MERTSRRKHFNATQTSNDAYLSSTIEIPISKSKSFNDRRRLRERKELHATSASDVEMSQEEQDPQSSNPTLLPEPQNYTDTLRRSSHRVLEENKKTRTMSMASSNSSESASEIPDSTQMSDQQDLIESRLADLETKRKMVQDGTFAEYCRRISDFKKEKTRLLQSAKWHQNLQLCNIKDLYAFDMKCAGDVAEQEKSIVKQNCLERLEKTLQQLQFESLEVQNKRKWIQEKFNSEIEQFHWQKRSKKRKLYGISATAEDIVSDFRAILEFSQSFASKATQDTKELRLLTRKRLLYDSCIYQEGDRVMVICYLKQERYVGTIESIAEDAMYMRTIPDKQKVRIYFSYLKTQRCKLQFVTRGKKEKD